MQGGGVPPVVTAGPEPVARVTRYLTDENKAQLGDLFLVKRRSPFHCGLIL